MDDFVLQTERTFQKYSMAAPGQTVVCALSGGVDSVCMTHVLAQLRDRLGIGLCAAHFSHGIRPQAAQAELALVQELCERLGIALYHGTGDAPAESARRGVSLEQAARELRYAFLRETAQRYEGAVVATAHHRDDSCETLLLNLVRGTGTVGLGGIPPVRGIFVRPLAEASRQQIEQYAVRCGLRWAQDESNFDQSIPRNLVRCTVMPALRSINPQCERNMVRCMENARRDGEFLLQCARALAGEARACPDGIAMDASRLKKAHPAVSGRAVRLLYVRAGGREGVFTERHAQAVLALCTGQSPSARTCLPGGIAASRCGAQLVMGPASAAPQPALQPVRLRPGETVRWGEWRLCLSPGRPQDFAYTAFLERRGTEDGLFVRARLPGDVIRLPGGSRSVKKLMIDRKIPQKYRDRIPVLCDNNKMVRALFWDRVYTAEKKSAQAVIVAAGRDET